MPRTMNWTTTAVSLLTCGLAYGGQGAMTKSDMDALNKGACAPDVKQFCGDITPGQGRIAACLKAHDDKVSKGCRDQIQAMRSKFMKSHEACQSDVQKFCGDVKMGGGRVMDCLQKHENELSAACKSHTQMMRGGKLDRMPGSSDSMQE